ncbi:MAG: hypothetical protein ACKVHF_05355 [Candidatus Poseidoniales archaeon]|jgi:ATP synthase H subunit|tara:strand:+ start:1133 stop:1447 length:315 start_codon:yes stop_codon:yes gene_type:complete
MSRADVLRAIKDAEIAASESIKMANKEASSIISNARQNANEIINSGRANSELDSQGLISKARSEAGSKAEIVSTDGKLEQENIHKSGDKNRIKAVKIVIDAFSK